MRVAGIRRRVIFHLMHRHYADLGIQVPLGYGCAAPILSPIYWSSFEEIFINGEYCEYVKDCKLPERWIDIGCHAGFFSLYLLLNHRRIKKGGDLRALMVDGDGRLVGQVQRLIELNGVSERFLFRHGAVAAQTGRVHFWERPWMSSGVGSNPAVSDKGFSREVPVLSADQILRLLPPPYDLIKIDVEGAEYEVFNAYQNVLRHSANVLLEWHSWHSGGGGKAEIIRLASGCGFVVQKDFSTQRQSAGLRGGVECGMLLLTKGRD